MPVYTGATVYWLHATTTCYSISTVFTSPTFFAPVSISPAAPSSVSDPSLSTTVSSSTTAVPPPYPYAVPAATVPFSSPTDPTALAHCPVLPTGPLLIQLSSYFPLSLLLLIQLLILLLLSHFFSPPFISSTPAQLNHQRKSLERIHKAVP